MNRDEALAKIKAHAKKHYNKGWDFVVECYSDADLLAEIDQDGYREVMRGLRTIAEYREEQMADARNSAF